MTTVRVRRFVRSTPAVPALFVAVILATAPLHAQTVQNWAFKILDDNDPTATAGTTNANGINDAGTAVGDYLVGGNLSSGFFNGFKYIGTYSNIVVNPGCSYPCNTLPTASTILGTSRGNTTMQITISTGSIGLAGGSQPFLILTVLI